MKNKKDFIIGFLIGIAGSFTGCFIALQFFTKAGFIEGFILMREAGMIGKVITLGAILNLIIFFLLLNRNKELMARGVILAMFILTVLTLIL
ncbi:hypothetical protein [Flavobacterium sp. U410]